MKRRMSFCRPLRAAALLHPPRGAVFQPNQRLLQQRERAVQWMETHGIDRVGAESSTAKRPGR